MILGAGSTQGTTGTQSTGAVINLSKGAKINLSKEAPGLKKIMFGLGWNTNRYSGGADFDLDASIFLVNASGKTSPEGFIFYNHTSDKGHYEGSRWVPDLENSSVIHTGDNRVGEDEEGADAEQIKVDLDRVPADVDRIAITVTIDSADERHQNFGMVSNAYCRLINTEDGNKEVVRFNLGEDFSVETAIVVGEVYRHNGDWKFNAIGSGFDGGLLALCRNYGLDAEYR
jgi:tellurium resistance protein TerD